MKPFRPALLAVLLSTSATAALAQDRRPTIEELEAQIQALAAQVADLKTQSGAEVADLRKQVNATATTLNNGRPAFATADGQFTAAIRTFIQLDGANYDQDKFAAGSPVTGTDLNSGTQFRRARIGVEGRLFKDFEYATWYDFGGSGTEGTPALHEGWVQYVGLKLPSGAPVRLRVGAFAPSLGLNDAASQSGSLFLERPASSEIARGLAGADKRIGVQVQSNGDHWLAALAVTGAKTGDAATVDEQLGYTARVAGTPLFGFDWRVHIGANASLVVKPAQATVGGPYSITLSDRPELRVDGTQLVTTGAIDADGARQLGLEFAVQKGPFLLQSEAFRYEIDRRAPAAGVTDPEFDGWYAEAAWVVTGEARKYNNVTGAFDAPAVNKPVGQTKGNKGAWELAGRYSVIDLDHNADSATAADRVRGGEQTIATVGVNWFLNPTLKLSAQYQDVEVNRRNAAGVEIGQDYQALAVRSQIAF